MRIIIATLLLSAMANAELSVDFNSSTWSADNIASSMPYYTNAASARAQVLAFDADTALFSGYGGPAVYGGVGVYSDDLSANTTRLRISNGSLQFSRITGIGTASYLFDISANAGSVTNLSFTLANARPSRLLVRTASGGCYASDTVWNANNASITDLTALDWRSYDPGSFTDASAGEIQDADLRWAAALGGSTVLLAGGDAIDKIGLSWDAGSTLNSGFTLGTFQVHTIPEPATAGLLVAMGLGILWIRRRFLI